MVFGPESWSPKLTADISSVKEMTCSKFHAYCSAQLSNPCLVAFTLPLNCYRIKKSIVTGNMHCVHSFISGTFLSHHRLSAAVQIQRQDSQDLNMSAKHLWRLSAAASSAAAAPAATATATTPAPAPSSFPPVPVVPLRLLLHHHHDTGCMPWQSHYQAVVQAIRGEQCITSHGTL